MSDIKFTFKPMKGKEPDAAKDEPKEKESDAEDSGEYSKMDLGKQLLTAIKGNHPEAVFEAFKKMSDCTPSDDK